MGPRRAAREASVERPPRAGAPRGGAPAAAVLAAWARRPGGRGPAGASLTPPFRSAAGFPPRQPRAPAEHARGRRGNVTGDRHRSPSAGAGGRWRASPRAGTDRRGDGAASRPGSALPRLAGFSPALRVTRGLRHW
ncbi:translation initiation factor IF-2-like isoform X2 [Moschus berezovskii]|uniref:translation initiation factor IF-2-like isoform X2 n=1 Tax=Moschus berezovskii TaxID=68408 RepID=UPI002443E1F8|nr:translation initiation factor IF-2-like isoform X2 [Moschus berezovskii]